MDGFGFIIFIFVVFSIISSVANAAKKEQARAKQQYKERMQREALEQRENANGEVNVPTYTPLHPSVHVPGEQSSEKTTSSDNYTPVHTTIHTSAPSVHNAADHDRNANAAKDTKDACAPHAPIATFEGDKKPLDERLRQYKEAKRATIRPVVPDDDAYEIKQSGIGIDISRDIIYDPQSVLRGVIYSEILGKPKSRQSR